MHIQAFVALICLALLMPYAFLLFKRLELSSRLLLISGLQLFMVSALLLNYLIWQANFLSLLCRVCNFIALIFISVNLLSIICIQLRLIFSRRYIANLAGASAIHVRD
jgi:hypothetical protein